MDSIIEDCVSVLERMEKVNSQDEEDTDKIREARQMINDMRKKKINFINMNNILWSA